MSNIFISNIVGTGFYAVPANDLALLVTEQNLNTLIDNVNGLSWERTIAWVKDSRAADGSAGMRTLNCLIEDFTYGGDLCPDSMETNTLVAAIEAALLAAAGVGTITSVELIEVNIVEILLP